MITSIRSAVVRFLSNKVVQSTLRHAAIAAGAVLVTAVTAGGVSSLTTGVIIAALVAAGRVILAAITAYARSKGWISSGS